MTHSRSVIRFLSRRREALITLFGIMGLLLFIGFYDRAFPSAAIDLSLSQAEIMAHAEAYMAARGYDVTGYKDALTFTQSSWTSIYLQRTLGIPETNRLIAEEELPVWLWRVRWFRPLQKASFELWLNPQGEVVGFTHIVLEDAPGASLSQEAARELAAAYLGEDRGWDLDALEPVSASSEERPGGRVDHVFSWKQRAWDVGESQLRLSVTLQGDEIGDYDYWLMVPESFTRAFSEKLNVAGFLDSVSFIGSFVLAGGLVFLALWHARWQFSPSMSRAAWPGLLTAVIVGASGLNALPLAKAWYSTTEDYRLFWIGRIFAVGANAVIVGVLVTGLWLMGLWLSRQAWPRQDRVLARRGDRLHHLARSGWRGLMLGGMASGYVVIFYLVATQLLGGWTPMGPDYSSDYATPLPFLGALESGVVPALMEEMVWRLILISGLVWATRTFTRWPKAVRVGLALLVPGALWGFAHSTYIRDPIVFRGIELTLATLILYAPFFLTFDLTTTIIAHFAYNAGLGALPLLRSGDPYFVASGVVVLLAMVAPMLPYLVREARRRLRGVSREVPAEPRIVPLDAGRCAAVRALPVEDVDWDALFDDPGAVILVLEAGPNVIGTAAGRITGDGAGDVVCLYVDPAWRRRYWGSDLLVALRDALRERGADTVRCQVDVADKGATYLLVGQLWTEARVTYRWPPAPRKPVAHVVREALSLKAKVEHSDEQPG